MKILIDKDKCFMSGECYYNHPEILEADDEGYPVVRQVVLSGELGEEAIRKHATEAAEVCPAVAITIEG